MKKGSFLLSIFLLGVSHHLKAQSNPSLIFEAALHDWEKRNNHLLTADEWKTKVDTLDLGSKGLSTLPEQVYQCANLRALNLSLNQFTALPAEIGALKNLLDLGLNGNPIPEAEQEKITRLMPEGCKIYF